MSEQFGCHRDNAHYKATGEWRCEKGSEQYGDLRSTGAEETPQVSVPEVAADSGDLMMLLGGIATVLLTAAVVAVVFGRRGRVF